MTCKKRGRRANPRSLHCVRRAAFAHRRTPVGMTVFLRGTARILGMTLQSPFTDVPDAIEEIRAGHMIIVVDDENRENEGDLTLAAEKVTPEAINFMAKHGRGLVCLAMTEE